MQAMNIGEVARQVGLQTSAIRYYESIGLMPAPPRMHGRRRYDSLALNRLHVIKAAREMGFGVGEIAILLNGFSDRTTPPERWRKLAEQKLPQVDEFIERALALKNLILSGLECDCEDISLCLATKGESCKSNDQQLIPGSQMNTCERADCG